MWGRGGARRGRRRNGLMRAACISGREDVAQAGLAPDGLPEVFRERRRPVTPPSLYQTPTTRQDLLYVVTTAHFFEGTITAIHARHI